MLNWLPLFLYLYSAVAGLLATSRTPHILGRYSLALALFNCWNVALCAFAFWAVWKRTARGQKVAYLLLILSSLAVPANGELRLLPAMSVVLPAIRLSAAVALLAVALRQFRQAPAKVPRLAVSLGAAFTLLSLTDYGLLTFAAFARTGERTDPGATVFRETYQLGHIAQDDLILVGDSFVWGAGVAAEEAFGRQLQDRYAAQGRPTRVYSLGQPGADVPVYIDFLGQVPREVQARRVILSFYLNDIPMPRRWQDQLFGVSLSLGHGCPTLRFVGDQVAKLFVPDVDTYFDLIGACYDRHAPDFPARWQRLEGQLREFRAQAAVHGDAKPVFLLLPLMVDFAAYPLNEAHADLVRLAESLGFEAHDLLPLFRARLGDGTHFRVAPNDNHFDASVHRLVAESLYQVLEARAP